MVEVGGAAPDFSAPGVADDVSTVTLSEHIEQGPAVLVFFPAAFTGTCESELETFQDRLGRFRDLGAEVLGISVDSPLVLSEFRERRNLDFPLISDLDREIIQAYDVTEDFPNYEVSDLAARAVIVIDTDQTVAWMWRGEPGEEPDYEAVEAAVADIPGTEGISTAPGQSDP